MEVTQVVTEASDGPAVNCIQWGDTVIVDCGDKSQFLLVKPKSKLKLGGAFCSVEPLIGAPYGSIFTLSTDGQSLQRTTHTVPSDWDAADEDAADNSKLVAAQDNQKLSREDIEAMKEAGADGEAIIAALAAHSATFETKTKFSQDKYKKKKAKKYIVQATMRRPSAAAVCQAYFQKLPAKIGFLRLDTLSTLLSLANVGAHARVLVMDSCGGMVTAAVAERLGGYGSVCKAHAGAKAPTSEALSQLNFGPAVKRSIRSATLDELLQQMSAAAPPPQRDVAAAAPLPTDAAPSAVPEAAQGPAAAAGGAAARAAQQTDGAAAAAGSGAAAVAAAAAAVGGPPFTSCILAVPGMSPLALVRAVLPLLAPSTPFAIYGRWVQPLAECLDALKSGQEAVCLALHESWWREQQVLPGRTHPLMNMNHGGGYVLSGTTVVPGPAPARRPYQHHAKKRRN